MSHSDVLNMRINKKFAQQKVSSSPESDYCSCQLASDLYPDLALLAITHKGSQSCRVFLGVRDGGRLDHNFLVLKPCHILLNTFLDATETEGGAGTTQLGGISAGLILVVALQVNWEVDSAQVGLGLTKVRHDLSSELVEARSHSSANIVDTADLWVVEEPAVETGDVFDMDEVTLLLSAFVSIVVTEELDDFELLAGLVELVRHTSLLTLVAFVGPVDVKQAQSRHLWGARVDAAANVLIKK